ncbi:MAG TPA: endolytic transglycosylase MltG [Anaerolineales bacterium]|nr:endolytic transglycosylase MltG [Anaerolineales bacterium]
MNTRDTQPNKPIVKRKSKTVNRIMRRLIAIFVIFMLCAGLCFVFIYIPARATRIYGLPASSLSFPQRVQYSALLLWYDGLVTQPLDSSGTEQAFTVEVGESVDTVANRLQSVGLIRDAEALRSYMIYAGIDTSMQAGDYRLSTVMSAMDIARKLQDATPEEVTFVILPGWRVEEIADSLPTSGLPITSGEFINAAQTPPRDFDFLAGASTVEGFLYPDSYIFSRKVSVNEIINEMLRNFAAHLTPELKNGFKQQGLSIYEAVTLASMVEREAVKEEEQPLIASVYLNRLKIGMKLDADPTVQYAIGYNFLQKTWWTNPLSLLDLQVNSVYNTYRYDGLPPSPIANPSLGALRAVAVPAETNYLFFRAKCDSSGYHVFAETFDEHLQNACP